MEDLLAAELLEHITETLVVAAVGYVLEDERLEEMWVRSCAVSLSQSWPGRFVGPVSGRVYTGKEML